MAVWHKIVTGYICCLLFILLGVIILVFSRITLIEILIAGTCFLTALFVICFSFYHGCRDTDEEDENDEGGDDIIQMQALPIDEEAPIVQPIDIEPIPRGMIDATCKICTDNRWQIVTRCGHMYCVPCFNRILETEKLCSYCRRELKLDESIYVFL
jgi:Zinc finger, C3HC4 type (RING finger)